MRQVLKGEARRLPHTWRLGTEIVLLAVAYVVSARLGLTLAFANENVTAVWPPTGIAVAALVLRGRRLWPGIALGALVANWTHGLPVHLAAGIAVGNTAAPLVAHALLQRLRVRPTLERVRDIVALIVAGGPLPMVISATVGTAVLLSGDELSVSALSRTWMVWWAGDAMGVVVFAPLILTMASIPRAQSPFFQQPLQALLLIAISVGAANVALRTDVNIRYIVLPFALWTAMRFEQHGAAVSAALLSMIAIWHTAGPGAHAHPTDVELLFLQGLNATLAITLLSFAAVMKERRRAQEELRRAAADLEDRVRARTADLAASEDRLARAQRLAHIGSFQWDARTDTNLWSDELLRIYGLPLGSDPPGMEDYLAFIDPHDRDRVRDGVTAAIASGESLGHEYAIVLRDGTRKWVHAYVEVICGPGDELLGLRGTCQDVTERRRAEDALRSSEEKTRALLDSAPDAMVVADQDGKIILVNDAVTNLLGYARDELLGRPVETLLPFDLRADHAQHRRRYLEHPRRRPMGASQDLSARNRAGELVPVDVSLSPVATHEGVVVFASIRDATERRRSETTLKTALAREQEASEHLRTLDASKNAFLSAVSHELRTPLTSILGFTELLQDDGLDEPTKADLLSRVSANALRLERLLGDLLDIDRLQRGILEPRRQRVNLRDLVDRALASMQLRDHPLTIAVDHTAVLIDPAQAERIVENLVSNAVKYTPPRSPITLSATALAAGGVTFVVSDEGSGVSDEQKKSIFEPFVRGGDDTFTQGTGIGLALVERFARLHGGRAWVEDKPGGGASFHVHLPGPTGSDEHADAHPEVA